MLREGRPSSDVYGYALARVTEDDTVGGSLVRGINGVADLVLSRD
jgi:hypothetical protein